MPETMLTPSLIWNGFNADEDLNASVIREYDENNVTYREVYFSAGTENDGVTRVYGLFACPKDTGKHAAVLYCHDVGETFDDRVVREFAENGFAVLGFDYSGEHAGGGRFTIYPKSLDYANHIRAGRHLLYVDESAKETCWYRWTVVTRYAAEFLRAQPETDERGICVYGVRGGGYFSWQLASYGNGVKCAVSLFEGGWTEYRGKFKHGDDSEIAVDEEREKWLAGVASQVYAKHVKVPFLYLGATNDSLGNCDRVSDSLLRVETYCGYAFAPGLNGRITESMKKTLGLFLRKFFLGENIKSHKSPAVLVTAEQGRAVAYVRSDRGAENLLYFCNGQADSVRRYWRTAKLTTCSHQVDGVKYNFFAELPVYEGDKTLTAYACSRFDDGSYFTSLVSTVRLAGKDITALSRERERMVFGAGCSASDFTALFPPRGDFDVFVPDDFVKSEIGAFGVEGVTAQEGTLTTFKINDPRFTGRDGATLKFDVSAKCPQTLAVTVYTGYRTAEEVGYCALVNVLGGELWQKAEIELEALKNASGSPLKSWKYADCISFGSDGKFLITNMIWL